MKNKDFEKLKRDLEDNWWNLVKLENIDEYLYNLILIHDSSVYSLELEDIEELKTILEEHYLFNPNRTTIESINNSIKISFLELVFEEGEEEK